MLTADQVCRGRVHTEKSPEDIAQLLRDSVIAHDVMPVNTPHDTPLSQKGKPELTDLPFLAVLLSGQLTTLDGTFELLQITDRLHELLTTLAALLAELFAVVHMLGHDISFRVVSYHSTCKSCVSHRYTKRRILDI